MMEQKKKCSKCGEEKTIDQFHKNKSRKCGIQSRCKECEKIQKEEYRIDNKDDIREYHKEKYENNKSYYHGISKSYYENNEEKIHDYHKIYYSENIESKKIYSKKYNEENKETNYLKEKERKKQKRKTDPAYKIEQDMRTRIYVSIKNYKDNHKVSKKDFVLIYLGITVNEFVKFLEQQFLPEMNWDNHGKVWEIDHIIPVASFNLMDKDECEKCFHYSNHQPLFKTTEIAKSFGYTDHIGNRNKYKN